MNYNCINFNQSTALYIVISLILSVLISVLTAIIPKELLFIIKGIKFIRGLQGLFLFLWWLLSLIKIGPLENCKEYIPFPDLNRLIKN